MVDPSAAASSPVGHWFEELADVMGPAYLRYSFTKGTEQEVTFLVDVLGLTDGDRLLDVGCGPGRHALAFARRGAKVHGIDISQRFVELAADAARQEGLHATFERIDARALDIDAAFDVVLSLCQGGFGLLGRDEDGAADADVLARMARALKPGGRLVVSAFSAYFQLRHLEDSDSFDAATGVNHEPTEVRGESGTKAVDLWTTCFTPRELRLMAERADLVVEHLWSVTPGAYARNLPVVERPEFLLVARRP
jgi:SAM-dependent methyltransferase